MALIPLNKFLTKTTKLTTSESYFEYTTSTTTSTVYTAPIGTTAIILMAQIANITTQTQSCSFLHHRRRKIRKDAQGNGEQEANVDSYLVQNFLIPPGDSASVLTGKLILEELDSIRGYSNTTTTSTLQLTLSVLETANT